MPLDLYKRVGANVVPARGDGTAKNSREASFGSRDETIDSKGLRARNARCERYPFFLALSALRVRISFR